MGPEAGAPAGLGEGGEGEEGGRGKGRGSSPASQSKAQHTVPLPPAPQGLGSGKTAHGLDAEGRSLRGGTRPDPVGGGPAGAPRHGGLAEPGATAQPPSRPRRTGITPMFTASTTVPWPCPSSSCYPRSTRRPEAQGPPPSWTALPFAALVSDMAARPCPCPPHKPLPSPHLTPRSAPEKRLLRA